MRTLELPANKPPREWGRIHGESFRGEIATLSVLRTYLCTKVGSFKTAEQVKVAATAHLPVLERYDAELYAELLGIAEGANVTPEEMGEMGTVSTCATCDLQARDSSRSRRDRVEL